MTLNRDTKANIKTKEGATQNSTLKLLLDIVFYSIKCVNNYIECDANERKLENEVSISADSLFIGYS